MIKLTNLGKSIKRTAALLLATLMTAACVDGAVISASAASGTLSNEERGVIYANTRTDFRDESIYFVMTTRFYNGDPSNDVQCWDVGPSGNYQSSYEADDPAWRGDFKGLIEKLDYIKALGFTAVWITPVVENCSGYDYHGYHAINFKKVDPRYESSDCKYQDLIDAVHAKGMKLIQDVVYNHTGNFGETNLCPMFTKEGDLSSPDCLKLAPGTALPSNYFDLIPDAQYQARLALMKNTDGVDHDVNNLYHHFGNFNWDDYTCQLAQIAGDCVDLNTENPLVYNYLVEAYSNYIKMGVDAFRVDTVRHISRLTLNMAFNQQLIAASKTSEAVANRNGYDFFMFGEVCCRDNGNYWYRNTPSMSCPFYTWKESKTYAWSDDPAQWETNYNSAIACSKDDNIESSISSQPTSTNAFLNGNDYHTPDYSKYSGLSVIDFPMHWSFRDAGGAYSVALRGDKYYNDATWNVTYVDSHDYAPDNAPENQRFAGDQATWAENLSLIFTFRGIPCIYYGSEIEFQKGCTIDKGPLIKLSESGRAYFGDHIEGDIVTSDFTVFNASGAVAETLKYPLAQHIIRLNRIRQAIPALRKGQYSTDGCSGSFAFKRRYTGNGVDSFALVTISGGATFSGIPNGTYVDAVTGDTKTVTNGTLTASCSGKGNIRVYVLNGPGRIVTNGTYITDGGSAELIGNENINVVKPTGISLNTTSTSVREAETVSLKATVTPSDAYNKSVSWTSSNENVATVSGGVVTGVSQGTATITAKTYNGLTATCTVTVTENTSIIKPSGITVAPVSLELTAGESGSLSATVAPSNATNKSVTWTSSDTNVATVTATGSVTAVNEGTATITASTFNGYKATATITVNPKQFKTIEHGIYFEKPSGWSSAYVYFFDKSTDSTVGASWPGTKMTDMGDGIWCYEYNNTNSNLWLVFNSGDGQQAADMQYVDCGYYTTAGYQKTVPYESNVTVDVTSVSVSKSSVSLEVGDTASVTATVAPSNATNKTITWTSSNSSVATVSGGTITAVAAGTATITAKSNNGKTATVSVTVTSTPDPTDLYNNSSINSNRLSVGSKSIFTGDASGGTAPYRYTYSYKRTTSAKWTTLGSADTYATEMYMTPSTAGTFDIKITVKDAAGATVDKTFSLVVVDGKSTAFKNTSTVGGSGLATGTRFYLNGSASGSSGYRYAYYYKRTTARSWTIIGEEFGTTTSLYFTPRVAVEFNIKIDVMDANGEIVSKQFAMTVDDKYAASTLTNNSTINTTYARPGTQVVINGAASGGSGYKYAFYYKKAAAVNWSVIGTEYGTATVAKLTLRNAGDYVFKADVKDSAGHVTSKGFTVEISNNAPEVAVESLKANGSISSVSVSSGTKVNLSAAPTGGTAPYYYAFYQKKTSATVWNVLGSEYGSTSTASFTPSSTGTYDVKITVMDSTGETSTTNYTVTVS